METDVAQELLQWVRSHFFGKYRGLVTDNSDPTKRGRLKVRVPSVLGTLEVWAMPCVPYAGAQAGFYAMPEPQTGVWVEFEAGDPSYPVWTGCFWADNEIPDTTGPAIKIWKTQKVTLRIDDDNDELAVNNTANSKITLASDVKTESGNATVTIGSSGVVSESGNGAKVEVAGPSVKVNDGALEVM